MYGQRLWLVVLVCCLVAGAPVLPLGSSVQAHPLNSSYPDGPGPSVHDVPMVGNLEIDWTVQVGTTANDDASELAYNAQADAVAVAGATSGSLFEPNAGSSDVWYANLAETDGGISASGQVGTVTGDGIGDMAVGSVGDVYMAGQVNRVASGRSYDYWGRVLASDLTSLMDYIDGTVLLDGATGVAALNDAYVIGGRTFGSLDPAVTPSAGDVFLRRYDELDDEASWTRQFSFVPANASSDLFADLAANGNGDLFAVGSAEIFDPLVVTAWIVQYNQNGTEIDRAQINPPISIPVGALVTHRATDVDASADGVYVAGHTTIDVLDQPFVRTSWLAKYSDDLGTPDWVTLIPGETQVLVRDMIVDESTGVIYVAGTGTPVDATGAGGSWLAAYSLAGEHEWTEHHGDATTAITALAVDGTGGLFIGGFTNSDLDGDGPEIHHGGNDAFIQKLSEPLPQYVIEVLNSDWIIDGVTASPGDIVPVAVDSVLEYICTTDDTDQELDHATSTCDPGEVRISRDCKRAIQWYTAWVDIKFNEKHRYDLIVGVNYLTALHHVLLYCLDPIPDPAAASVVPQASLEMALTEGGADYVSRAEPLYFNITTDEASIAASAPFHIEVGRDPENGIVGVTTYSGDLLIAPTGNGLEPFVLTAGQGVTITSEVIGEVIELDRLFMPSVRR